MKNTMNKVLEIGESYKDLVNFAQGHKTMQLLINHFSSSIQQLDIGISLNTKMTRNHSNHASIEYGLTRDWWGSS